MADAFYSRSTVSEEAEEAEEAAAAIRNATRTSSSIRMMVMMKKKHDDDRSISSTPFLRDGELAERCDLNVNSSPFPPISHSREKPLPDFIMSKWKEPELASAVVRNIRWQHRYETNVRRLLPRHVRNCRFAQAQPGNRRDELRVPVCSQPRRLFAGYPGGGSVWCQDHTRQSTLHGWQLVYNNRIKNNNVDKK